MQIIVRRRRMCWGARGEWGFPGEGQEGAQAWYLETSHMSTGRMSEQTLSLGWGGDDPQGQNIKQEYLEESLSVVPNNTIVRLGK